MGGSGLGIATNCQARRRRCVGVQKLGRSVQVADDAMFVAQEGTVPWRIKSWADLFTSTVLQYLPDRKAHRHGGSGLGQATWGND